MTRMRKAQAAVAGAGALVTAVLVIYFAVSGELRRGSEFGSILSSLGLLLGGPTMVLANILGIGTVVGQLGFSILEVGVNAALGYLVGSFIGWVISPPREHDRG